MIKRGLLILVGVLLITGAAAYIYYGKAPSSAEGFSNKSTANLASLVKQRTSKAPPNVVIILADDLGWADVGYHGSDIKTPNIDRLAKEGMRLERFYATPICTPTRSALMTGRDPIKLGVANSVLMAWQSGGVSPEEKFMPESFKAAGYETAMVGKWHLGQAAQAMVPNSRGFDHFYGHLNTQVDYFKHEFANGHDLQQNGKSVRRDGEYATDIHGEEAARFITESRDKTKPFFLYVPFLAPHSPIEAKDEDISKYPRRLDTPMAPKKTYAAMVDSMDQAIGRIMTALDKEGVADNTIILFFSDNGGFANYGADNSPLRGGKLEAFEGGVRVTAVMRWPDVLPANSVNDAVISVMDIFPTLAAATGVPTGTVKEIDGIDRWNAVLGKGDRWRGSPLVWTSNIPVYNLFSYGVLNGKWKLVQTVDHQRRSTSVETMLFDVDSDPNEKTDISAAHPDQVKQLTKILDARLAEHPVGGLYVQIAPNPGWRAPKDYADVVIPAEQENVEPYEGFGSLASRVLQQRYGEKGRINYK